MYISESQLAALLQGYERVGTSEATMSALDSQLRGFVERAIQVAVAEIQTRNDVRVDQVSIDLQKLVETGKNHTHALLAKEIAENGTALRASIQESVEKQVFQMIQTKVDQLTTNTNTSITRIQVDTAETLQNIEKTFAAMIQAGTTRAIEAAQTEAREIAMAILSSGLTQVQRTIESTHTEQLAYITEGLSKLTQALTAGLQEKETNREQLLSKIADVEADIRKKTESVIRFQVEQSRRLMEMAARDEMRHGLQAAMQVVLENTSE